MDAKATLDGAAMSTIANTANTVIQNLYQTQNVQKKQGPGTQEFGKTNVRGRESGLPD